VSTRGAESVECVTAYVKDSDFEDYMLDVVPEQNQLPPLFNRKGLPAALSNQGLRL
jgi:hypothetical protein